MVVRFNVPPSSILLSFPQHLLPDYVGGGQGQSVVGGGHPRHSLVGGQCSRHKLTILPPSFPVEKVQAAQRTQATLRSFKERRRRGLSNSIFLSPAYHIKDGGGQ